MNEVYSVRYVYSIHGSLCSVHGTMYNLPCTLYNVQCTSYNVMKWGSRYWNIFICNTRGIVSITLQRGQDFYYIQLYSGEDICEMWSVISRGIYVRCGQLYHVGYMLVMVSYST